MIKMPQLRRVWLGLIQLMVKTSFDYSVLNCYIEQRSPLSYSIQLPHPRSSWSIYWRPERTFA